jgi:23S rRNA pseudouridine2457 synthase
MQSIAHRYFMLNKVYGMESQFVSNHPTLLLGDVKFDFPVGIHAIGRLDKPSEGLLLLTTNKKITSLLFKSKIPHKRTYLVQVKSIVSDKNIDRLRNGIPIRVEGGGYYTTLPCEVSVVQKPDDLFSLPFPHVEYGPTSWLEITLTQGKFRQIRKMIMALKLRCMRLIRISIEDIALDGLPPGGIQEFTEADFFDRLKLSLD